MFVGHQIVGERSVYKIVTLQKHLKSTSEDRENLHNI